MNLQVRNEYKRLLGPEDLPTMIEGYKIVTDAGFTILNQHGREKAKTVWDHDGKLLFQMTVLKSLSLLQLSNPISYSNSVDGSSLNNTYDPFAMDNLVRAQYEAFCNFNNIYIQSKSEDERVLKYNLWVLSGLNYRQRFNVTSDYAIEKKKNEAKEIEELVAATIVNKYYLQLDEQSKKNINDGIKKRDWQFKVDGNKAYKVGWHEMMTNAGANTMLDDQYSHLSLNTHPSNVSVFQFGSMYREGLQEFNVRMALKLSKIFIAMFIRDYCIYFSGCGEMFNKLPSIHQLLINSYNTMFRGEAYKLNDHWKEV